MSNSQKQNELMEKLHDLFTQHQSKPDERKSLNHFREIWKNLEVLLLENGISKDDIKKHKEAIIDALKSEQPQETAFSALFNAINKKNVLKEALPRPQAMKKDQSSEKTASSASKLRPGVRDNSVDRAKIAKPVIIDRSKNMPS